MYKFVEKMPYKPSWLHLIPTFTCMKDAADTALTFESSLLNLTLPLSTNFFLVSDDRFIIGTGAHLASGGRSVDTVGKYIFILENKLIEQGLIKPEFDVDMDKIGKLDWGTEIRAAISIVRNLVVLEDLPIYRLVHNLRPHELAKVFKYLATRFNINYFEFSRIYSLKLVKLDHFISGKSMINNKTIKNTIRKFLIDGPLSITPFAIEAIIDKISTDILDNISNFIVKQEDTFPLYIIDSELPLSFTKRTQLNNARGWEDFFGRPDIQQYFKIELYESEYGDSILRKVVN